VDGIDTDEMRGDVEEGSCDNDDGRDVSCGVVMVAVGGVDAQI
jgi:hypothetical protein